MIAGGCPAIVRSYCWSIFDVAVTYVRDGQTESARPLARAYEYPAIGSIQQSKIEASKPPRNTYVKSGQRHINGPFLQCWVVMLPPSTKQHDQGGKFIHELVVIEFVSDFLMTVCFRP